MDPTLIGCVPELPIDQPVPLRCVCGWTGNSAQASRFCGLAWVCPDCEASDGLAVDYARLEEQQMEVETFLYPVPADAALAVLDSPLAYAPVAVGSLPLRDRPASRLAEPGPAACSTTELLAAVVRGPRQLEKATRLIQSAGGLLALGRCNVPQVQKAGLGAATAASVVAAMELGRRLTAASSEERLQIRTPADVAALLIAEMSHLEQEEFRVVLLDTRNRVLGIELLYKGSLNQSQVRVAEAFREAVRRNCAAIIVAHNHPSGDPSPSPEDVAVTRDLVAGGKLLGVDVLDHLVVGAGRWVSLRERGLGFEGV